MFFIFSDLFQIQSLEATYMLHKVESSHDCCGRRILLVIPIFDTKISTYKMVISCSHWLSRCGNICFARTETGRLFRTITMASVTMRTKSNNWFCINNERGIGERNSVSAFNHTASHEKYFFFCVSSGCNDIWHDVVVELSHIGRQFVTAVPHTTIAEKLLQYLKDNFHFA